MVPSVLPSANTREVVLTPRRAKEVVLQPRRSSIIDADTGEGTASNVRRSSQTLAAMFHLAGESSEERRARTQGRRKLVPLYKSLLVREIARR
eukprot:2559001-Alexandrium_andersonii.AAC.1